jgi:hypothetical protein
MRFKGQIPAEVTRGSSSRQRRLAQESARGGKRRKRIEPANQARITSASDPTVSRGNDGQEEEQAAGCLYSHGRLQSQVRPLAPQPYTRGASNPSAHPPTPRSDRKSNTRSPWSGMLPILSAPNASCPFSPHWSKRLTRHEHLYSYGSRRKPPKSSSKWK